MGTNGKAIAAFGMLMLEAPQHGIALLTALVTSLPGFWQFTPMVQDGLIFFLVKVPVAGAAAAVVWYVRNHPGGPLTSDGQPDTRILPVQP